LTGKSAAGHEVLQMNFLQSCRHPLKRKATVQGKFSTWMEPDFSGNGMPSQMIPLINEKTTPGFKAARNINAYFCLEQNQMVTLS
jgi:hypothetical protein